MNKNFFYIAQYFTPEPYLKDIDFIKSLRDKGWQPVVITGFPNYPKGEIYEGFKNNFFSEEILDGVRIIRTYTYADHSLSTFKRILNYAVFGVFASIAILKYGKKNSFYYILQSSPFVLFCAYIVRLFKPKSVLLLDVQDVFPENIRVSGFVKQQWKIDFLDFILNTFYYRAFDLFVTVSESFRKIVANKGISKDKILTLFNWSMVEKKPNENETDYEFSTKGFNIVYAGNIGVHQGLSKLSEGISEVISQNPEIYFHFFGDGTDFEPLKKELVNNQNIVFHGRVSPSEIGKYLEAADALFIHLIKDPIYESIIPSKLQAYIEIGKPILAGIEGEAKEFVVTHKLGVSFPSENVNDFILASLEISKMTDSEKEEVKKRSLQLYQQQFSRKSGVDKLHHFMTQYYEG